MYLRSALQPDLFSAGGDQFLADLQHLRANLTRFASGLSRVRDFKVAAWSGHGVGVEIGEMSAAAIGELARVIVDYGCPAFCDSGAFGVFQRTLRGGAPTPLDFDDILRRYDALSDAIQGYNAAETPFPAPLMVMPDIVGDQLGSLALIEHHRTYVRSAAFFPGVSRPIMHFRDHLPIREIARRTGLSRNTIRKYLRSETIDPRFKVPDRPSKLDPFAEPTISCWSAVLAPARAMWQRRWASRPSNIIESASASSRRSNWSMRSSRKKHRARPVRSPIASCTPISLSWMSLDICRSVLQVARCSSTC